MWGCIGLRDTHYYLGIKPGIVIIIKRVNILFTQNYLPGHQYTSKSMRDIYNTTRKPQRALNTFHSKLHKPRHQKTWYAIQMLRMWHTPSNISRNGYINQLQHSTFKPITATTPEGCTLNNAVEKRIFTRIHTYIKDPVPHGEWWHLDQI